MTPEPVERVPVVVIGAGPTGVTVATLLAQYGIDVLVLDRWADVYPQPRAVHLDDEVCRVLGRLGIADEFAAISRPALGLRLLDGSMTMLAEFTRDGGLSRNGFPSANMFDQPDLEGLLRVNLTRYPHAELRGNVEVADIAASGGRVRVTYADRAGGAQRLVEADYLLGCDGANSMARDRIGSTMNNLGFEQRWLVADVETPADLGQWEGVHQVCDPVRAGTYMRIGHTRYRWEFRLLDGETSADFDTIDALGPLIAPWVAGVDVDDVRLVRVTEYTFRAQLADRWRRGRIFLLGDAAHLTPPFIGQGMGAGMRDAMNLAWKLAGVIDGSLPADVLATYEQERRPHARSMIRMARSVGHAMTAGGRAGDLVRRLVLPRLDRVPGLNAKVMNGETPALRRTMLVQSSRTPWRLAGTLCPNPLVGPDTRLDDVLGSGFAVITTNAPAPAERTVIQRHGAELLVVPPHSELAHWLHRRRVTAAIVRPDRTVMTAGRNLRSLSARLPRFQRSNATPETAGMTTRTSQ